MSNKRKSIIGLGLLSCYSTLSFGAGFALTEQNASNLGNAYAGRAAVAEDISTNFYNPAGLARFSNHQVAGSIVGVLLDTKVNMNNATRANGLPLTTGKSSDNAGDFGLVPALHLGGPLSHFFQHNNNQWFYGLSVTAPFGLKTSYGRDTQFRYFATKSELKVIDVNPNVAYKFFNNKWSLAGGLSVQFLEANLNRQVDNLLVGSLIGDGTVKNNATSTGLGYNLGLLFQPSNNTRYGLAYRSKVRHKARGKLKVNNISPTFTAFGLVNQDLKADVTLPEMLSLSSFQSLNSSWDLMGDISYTHWSRFKTLVLRYEDTTLPNLVTNQNFKNSLRIALGTNYKIDNLVLKFGLARDMSPVKKEYRNFRIPDSNRWWLSTGIKYSFAKNSAIDLGYSRLFASSTYINEVPIANPPFNRASANAKVKGKANLLGLQLTFDLF